MKILKHTLILSIASLLFACTPSGPSKTSEGFEYTIHQGGDQLTQPKPGDYAYFEMEIKDPNGEVLQSMRNLEQMPVIEIPSGTGEGQRPNPISDVLANLTVGDSATLKIPLDSIPNAGSQLKDFDHIIYEIMLRDVKVKADYDKQVEEQREKMKADMAASQAKEGEIAAFTATTLAEYKAGALNDKIVTDESGLKYVIHEKGEGAIGQSGESVSAHYYGVLASDGSMFDNSYKRGTPYTFTLGQRGAIDGWDVGFQRIPRGSKATLFIPYQMAYGESGRPPSIPAKSELVFYVELQE